MAEKETGPYRELGSKIKFLRQQWNQSIDEVCGTLEIEEQTLKSIEDGKTLPADELLEMLISHFLLTDEQAMEIKQLANSQKPQDFDSLASGIEEMLMKNVVMLMPTDNKVVYTDGMQATVNDSGVVMKFVQSRPGGQQAAVSHLGMSRQHAEKVVKVLQDTLREYDRGNSQKLLPKPEQNKRKK